jgi:hypothetical protein
MEKQEAMEKYLRDRFVREFRRGLRTMEQDPKAGKEYMERSFRYLRAAGMPEHRLRQAVALASQNQGTLISRIQWDYYMKNVKPEDRAAKTEAFKKVIKQENQRFLRGQQ